MVLVLVLELVEHVGTAASEHVVQAISTCPCKPVCVRERERERKKERGREGERERVSE